MSNWFDSEIWVMVGIPALIFVARVTDVALGTMRIILVTRGARYLAPLLGFFEILIWLVAISQVVQNLEKPLNFLAYAAGFAAGTWVGLIVEDKLALGLLAVRIITAKDASDLLKDLEKGEFGVTSFAARGIHGRVRLFLTITRKRDFKRLLKIVRGHHPDAFISVSDVRIADRGYIPGAPQSLRGRLELLRKK